MVIGSACGAGLHLRGLLAAEPENSSQFEEQLAAGEFAPALTAPKSRRPRGSRRPLVRIGAGPGSLGARDSAFSTLAYIGDDCAQYSAVQSTQAAAPPAGAPLGGVQADFTR